MSSPRSHRYRAAIDVLQKGRELLVDELAGTVLDQADDLLESGYAFNEFLENHGTRLHFLCLLLSQLEQSAEMLDEAESSGTGTPDQIEVFEAEILTNPAKIPKQVSTRPRQARPARPRSKKLERQTPAENSPDEA